MTWLRSIGRWLSRQFEFQEVLWFLGLMLVSVGIGYWSMPASFVVSGVLLLALSWPHKPPAVQQSERPRRVA